MSPLLRRSRFEFGGQSWTTTYTTRPWVPGDFTIGGSRTSAAGIPAAYVVRRDALVELTLRVTEAEYPRLLALIRYGQSSQTFVWYPDANDTSDAVTVYLEAPLAGERWSPTRDGAYPRHFEMTITLRQSPYSLRTWRGFWEDSPVIVAPEPGSEPGPIGGDEPAPPPEPSFPSSPPPPPPPEMILFQDDFHTGARAGTQNGCRWTGVNGAVAPAVVADPNNPSGYSLRFRFLGNPSLSADAFCEQNYELHSDGFEQLFFYLEWEVPENYVHRNDPSGPDNNKGLRIWGGYNATDTRDVSYANASVKAGYSTLAYDPSHANYGDSQIITEFGNLDAVGTGNWGTGPWTPWFARGTIERHAMFVRVGTTAGASVDPGLGGDAILQLWRNGVQVYNRNDLDIYTSGGWNRFRHGYVLGWANSGFTAQTDFLLRRIVIATDIIPELIL